MCRKYEARAAVILLTNSAWTQELAENGKQERRKRFLHPPCSEQSIIKYFLGLFLVTTRLEWKCLVANETAVVLYWFTEA